MSMFLFEKRAAKMVSIIAVAYQLNPMDFYLHNKDVFSNCRVFIVSDKAFYFDSSNWLCIPYNQFFNPLNLPRALNHGIRAACEQCDDNDIIIRTDLDIVFSKDILADIQLKVKCGYGYCGICSRIESYDDIKNIDWLMAKKWRTGYGACFALTKQDWVKIYGYNENLIGHGLDDDDVYIRARAAIYVEISSRFPLYHINHTSRNNVFPVNKKFNRQAMRNKWSNAQWGMI